MPITATGAHAKKQTKTTKLQTIIQLLQRPGGALLDELVSATAWQKHSVRGAISGALKEKHKLQISSTEVEGRGRIYRIETPASEHEQLAVATADNAGGVQP